MLEALKSGALRFPPLVVAAVDEGRKTRSRGGASADAVVVISWGRREFRFAVQCKALSTPKVFATAQDEALRGATAIGLAPLIFVPYLSPEQITELEIRGVSGLDLCGNGIIVVPGELLVVRGGNANPFRPEGRIKNVYRKNSSIVAQVFLLRPKFESVGDVEKMISAQGGTISLATISKVIATLDADLVIEREASPATKLKRVRLLQPEKLLDLLATNYAPPEITRTFTGKIDLPAEKFREALRKWREKTGGRIRATGESSVAAYAAMPREDLRAFYCSDVASLISSLGGEFRETERFPNLKLLETRDEFAYFGGDPDETFRASPIQTYLELAAGDKRDRETAEQVRRVILDRAKGASGRDS